MNLRIMWLLWQCGLVDTFTFFQFATNAASQYGSIVVGAASGNFSTIRPKTLLEPVLRLGVSCKYVIAAQTALERQARVAAFLSSSTGSAITADPATNAALGGAIVAKIAMMRWILARGGRQAVI